MTDEPIFSAEAEAVLGAIQALDSKLETTQESMEENTRQRISIAFRQVLAVIAVCVLVVVGAGIGYAQYDRVSRCHSRADTIETIKQVIAKDHDALPKGLIDGFGDNPDTKRVVAVIRASYDKSEQQIDLLLPTPDCSGFLP